MMSSLLLLLLVFSITTVRGGSRDICTVCRCREDKEHEGLIVDCSNCSLKEIPSNLHPDTTRLIMRHNQIREIRSGVFNKTKLRHIDLSYNLIRKVLPLSFQGLHKLLSLDLHRNKFSLNTESYPNESFASLVNLEELDISENLVNTGRNIREKYPDITLSKLVSLQSLKVDGIPTLEMGPGFARISKLRFLNFSGNCETSRLTSTSFRNVKNIHALTISGCKINSIHDSAFGVFENLQFLDVSYNVDLGLNKSTSALRSLRSSQFKILNITAVENTFGISFEVENIFFKNIQHLNITQLYMNSNRIELFTVSSEFNVPSTVKFVGLRDNLIAYGPYVFAMLLAPSLECIDVSYQYVSHMPMDSSPKIDTWNYIKDHCDGLQNFVEISEKSLSDSNTTNELLEKGVGRKLSSTRNNMMHGSYTGRSVRGPSINHKRSTYKDPIHNSNSKNTILGPSFRHEIPSSLQDMKYVHSNPVYSPIDEEKTTSIEDKSYNKFGNILKSDSKPVTYRRYTYPHRLNTSFNRTVFKERGARSVKKSYFRNQLLRYKRGIPIPLPYNLTYFNGSTSKFSHDIPELHFIENNVTVLDISSNIIKRWIGPVYGLHKLEWLSLGNNLCTEVHKGFFNDLGSLKHLFIGSNYLSESFEADVNGDTLKPLGNLETLDMSNNRLRSAPSPLLCGLRSLKRLDISTNFLNEWTIILDHMHDLEFINMSTNLLTTLPASFQNFADRQFANNRKLTIDMSGQLLDCRCDDLEFYKWMNRNTTSFTDRRHYKCRTMEGGELSLENLDLLITQLEKKCVSWTLLVIITTCSIILICVLVVAALIYRYRWKIRYVYYLARNKYRGYYTIRPEIDTEFTYDAFISYADNDRRFVVNHMVKNLETAKGRQLCIHHRDFLVGEIIAANILNAVRNSRKTVIILTRNLLKSYWCMYELNMALMEELNTGRNVLIVVVYEHIPVEELPKDIVRLMSTNSYLEYPNDPEGDPLFWENLSLSISVD